MNNNNPTHVIATNITPVRVKPDADSEQDTQCTLGQSVTAYETFGEWTRIYCIQDNLFGWVRSCVLITVDMLPRSYKSLTQMPSVSSLIADVYCEPTTTDLILTKLTIGTKVANILVCGEWTQIELPNSNEGWIESQNLELIAEKSLGELRADKILKTAFRFVGVPYLWGGTTPFGLDCSGFVQLIFRLHGVWIPRNADQQYRYQGCRQIQRSDIVPADLLFFGNEHCISHVGIALNDTEFIHSSGSLGVCISRLDESPFNDIYFSAGRIMDAD